MDNFGKMTAEEYQQHIENKPQKAGKYKSIRVQVDGIWFDSKKEAGYYGTEKMKLKAGDIKGFRRQVRFKIVINGTKICTYVADFVEDNWDGSIKVIDVKSDFTRTLALYKIKKKLMEVLYGITIIEV